MLVAAELAPHGVELSRHSQIGLADGASISRGKWKVVVAPAAGRKGLDLKMAEVTEHGTVTLWEMSRVMEHRHVWPLQPRCSVRFFEVSFPSSEGLPLSVLRVLPVE